MKSARILVVALMFFGSSQAHALGVRDLFTQKFDAKGSNCFETLKSGQAEEYGPYHCGVTINGYSQGMGKIFDIMIDGQRSIRMYGLQLWNDDVMDIYAGVKIGRVIGDRIEVGMVGSKKTSWILISPSPSGDSLIFQDFLYRSDDTYSRSDLKLSVSNP